MEVEVEKTSRGGRVGRGADATAEMEKWPATVEAEWPATVGWRL